MRIIPVLDLLRGQVVRGVAGERAQYRPVESRLCLDASPASVAQALRTNFAFSQAYIADLDAILHHQPNWAAYAEVAAASFELLIDAGLKSVPEAERLLAFLNDLSPSGAGQGSIVAALETVSSSQLLSELLELVGPKQLVFSLDMKVGKPLTQSPDWHNQSAEHILAKALMLGVERFILLDLSRVGVGTGVGTDALCQSLRAMAPTVEIIAGGGVRGIDDLRALQASGCDAVLIASALHNGTLNLAALAEFQP